MGAPAGNTNALTHGMRVRHGITLGSCGKSYARLEADINRLRKAIEAAVLESKGEISLMDCATINTACRWEQHAALARKWLRDNPGLIVTERLQFSREIAKAAESRDKSLRLLGLGEKRDIWANILTPLAPLPPYESQAAPTPGNAQAANLGDQAADSVSNPTEATQ